MKKAVEILVNQIIIFSLIGSIVGICSHYFTEIAIFSAEFVRDSVDYQSIGFVGWNAAIKIAAALFIAALVISLLIRFSKIDRFHGPADVILASIDDKSPIKIKEGIISGLVSSTSLCAGAPVGQYGPLVHISATLASFLRRLENIGSINYRLLMGSSVSAAIASAFGAPIGGIIFSQEVILRNFSLKYFAPIAISSASSFITTNYLFGNENLINIEKTFNINPIYMMIVVIVGLLGGVAAYYYSKSLMTLNRAATGSGIPLQWRPFLGILPIILIGIFIPQVLGLGVETISNVLNNRLDVWILLAVLVAKFVLTPISISFGLFGGVFSPALFIGLALGALVGTVVSNIFSLGNDLVPLFAICGLGAVIAPTIGGPIATVILILEMSQNFHASTVAMLCVVVSMITFRLLSNSSFFEMQLLARGFDLSVGMKNFQLSLVNVGEIPRSECCSVLEGSHENVMISEMQGAGVTEGYVLDREGKLVRKVNLVNLLQSSDDPENDELVFFEDQNLLEAVELASDFVGESIPIVKRNGKFVGALTEGDLFQAVQSRTASE